MKFAGKTALITGAAVGIGRATALTFAEEGAKLVLVDIDLEKLENVKKELSKFTNDVLIYKCDVSDEEAVYSVVKDAEEKFEKIDILVNNAAIWRVFAPFNTVTADMWKRLFDINVMGTVYFSKAVIDGMTERGFGRIINVCSVAGVYGNRNMAPYSATKGAVISLTKSIAKEVAEKGVTVNAVSPGTVSPSDNSDIDHFVPSDVAYLGRTGTDRENAALIAFLASNEAAYISGENILIDGCRKRL